MFFKSTGRWGAALWNKQSFSIIFSEAVYTMAFFGNDFHTNCIINLLQCLCLEGTKRSLCCALLPVTRIYVLPLLLRGCQSPGWLSWGLCKAWSFASLCQGATCPIGAEQPHLSPLILSVKLRVNVSVNFQKELSQGQSKKQKEGIISKVQRPITQAVGEIWKEDVFSKESIPVLVPC